MACIRIDCIGVIGSVMHASGVYPWATTGVMFSTLYRGDLEKDCQGLESKGPG